MIDSDELDGYDNKILFCYEDEISRIIDKAVQPYKDRVKELEAELAMKTIIPKGSDNEKLQ